MRKSTIGIVLSAAVMLAASTASAADNEKLTITNEDGYVLIYDKPFGKGPPIDRSHGLYITAITCQDGWCTTRCGGTTNTNLCYFQRSDVFGKDDAPAGGGGADNGNGGGMRNVTVNDDVDLYDQPGGDGQIIGMLEKGQTIGMGQCSDGWCQVAGGWVWGEFLNH